MLRGQITFLPLCNTGLLFKEHQKKEVYNIVICHLQDHQNMFTLEQIYLQVLITMYNLDLKVKRKNKTQRMSPLSNGSYWACSKLIANNKRDMKQQKRYTFSKSPPNSDSTRLRVISFFLCNSFYPLLSPYSAMVL